MNKVAILAILSILFGPECFSEETEKQNATILDIRESCIRYLAICSTKKDQDDWNKKMDQRVEQKVLDNSVLDESSASHAIVLDWIVDHREGLEKNEVAIVKQACMFFVRFMDRRIDLPVQIIDKMTFDRRRKLREFLEEQIKVSAASSGLRNGAPSK